MADDWFRSPRWDAEARDDFELRLGRARAYNRPQYLRVKALALQNSGQLEAAKILLHRSIERLGGYNSQVASATEQLADIAVQQREPRLAEEYYRRLLSQDPSLNATTGTAEIALAELLIDTGREEALTEADDLLCSWVARDGLKFDNVIFRWHVALVGLAKLRGDRDTVRQAAKNALEVAGRGPRLPRHKDVGLVRADARTLRRLRRLAR